MEGTSAVLVNFLSRHVEEALSVLSATEPLKSWSMKSWSMKS